MIALRIRRHAAGWSVRAIADKAGLTYHELRRIEEGREATPETMQRIEAALAQAEQHGPATAPRGFSLMSEEQQRKIASRGGKLAHQLKRAHEFDRAEAQAAGRIGGAAVARDRAYMARIGAKGGIKRGQTMEARRRAVEHAKADQR